MKKNFLFGKKWFFEDFLPDSPQTSTWGFLIEKEVYSGKSKFQRIEVFDTKEFGRVLVLDGIVQLSTRHEFIYHEMLVHPAMLYHSKAKRVLIIGGGDGGTLREVAKYPVKEIFQVDIDKKVIEVSKKYLPSLSKGAFDDKRLRFFNEDALEFIKRYNNFFDVIINDLTDPTPVARFCWNVRFYRLVSRALKEDGVAGFQSGSLKEKFPQKARKDLAKVFPFFVVHRAFVDCFPFDEYTFSFGSKTVGFDEVAAGEIKKRYKKFNLKTNYYSSEIHFNSTVFPKKYPPF